MRQPAEAVTAVSLWIVVSADASHYHDLTGAGLVTASWARLRKLWKLWLRRPANQPDV